MVAGKAICLSRHVLQLSANLLHLYLPNMTPYRTHVIFQPLRAIRFTGALMGSVNLQFQPRILLVAFRWLTSKPCVVTARRHLINSAHHRHRIVLMQRFHHRLLHRIPFAKYAAAFFNRSRSILTSASSRFVLANSNSTSVRGRCVLPISLNFPLLAALSQFPSVGGGNDSRFAVSLGFNPSRQV